MKPGAAALPGAASRRARDAGAVVAAALAIAVLLAPPAQAEAPQSGYHVAARYALGGTDIAYDYLRIDDASRHLFVAHGTRIEVLDADTGARVGQIPELSGAHGIEIIAPLHMAYATSGIDRTVVMFDPATLQVVKRIKYLGERPDGVQYDADSGLLYVVNSGATGDISLIEPATGAIVGSIDLAGGKLEEIAFDGHGRGFVNDERRSVIHVFDTRTRKRVADWPLAPAEGPTGLAIDRTHHRLFSACGNGLLAVVDTDTGNLVGTVPIGPEPDGAVFDPKSGRVFTSNRDGTMTVIGERSPGSYAALQTVRTESGARTLTLDERTGRIFLPAGRLGPVPAPTPAVPEPRAPLIPDSFAILVVAP